MTASLQLSPILSADVQAAAGGAASALDVCADPVLQRPSHSPFQRKDAILTAACDHFGRHGFRGASLRAIAQDAGVSLTLLNHHFDNKAGLLSAVVAMHRPRLSRRALELKRMTSAAPGVVGPRDLVRAWATLVFEAAATPDGRRFLRLLARMTDDASAEALAVRTSLSQGTEAFVDALQHCYPAAPRPATVSAWLCADACLVRMATNVEFGHGSTEPGQGSMPAVDRARLERFVEAGIEASLSMPSAPFQAQDVAEMSQGGQPLAHS